MDKPEEVGVVVERLVADHEGSLVHHQGLDSSSDLQHK
jgi:hypothetical protein